MKDAEITKYVGVIIRDDKYLIAKDKGKDFYTNVGGKPEEGESPAECLAREIAEELSVKVTGEPKYYFSTPVTLTENEPKRTLVIHLYKVEVEGEPKPGGEIEKLQWFSKEEYDKKEIRVAMQIQEYIMPRLIKDRLVK